MIRTLLVAIALVVLGIVVWLAVWKQWAVYKVVRNVDRKGADYVRPAADALVEHAKGSVPVFVELLKHEDMYVRMVAAEKLGDLGPEGESVDALVAALHDDESRVRMAAVNFLSKWEKLPSRRSLRSWHAWPTTNRRFKRAPCKPLEGSPRKASTPSVRSLP